MRLHDQGLIYRGSYLVNWSPNLQTAVSDLEVTALVQPHEHLAVCGSWSWLQQAAQIVHIAHKMFTLQLCGSASISCHV